MILVFHAEWCGPCNQMKEHSWPTDGVCQQIKYYASKKIYRINADKYPDWVEKYHVNSLPTIIIIDAKTFKETSRNVGFMTAEQLERFLSYPDHVSFSSGESFPIRKKSK